MRVVSAEIDPRVIRRAHRIVTVDNLASQWVPELRFIVMVKDSSGVQHVEELESRGITNVFWANGGEFEIGDVVVPEVGGRKIHVSFRDSDLHHSLFVTNQCNSYCLMCSQPPTKQEDGWLVDEALDIVRHIGNSPRVLGITGGEPLLLGQRLRSLLDTINLHHPDTRVDLLSNGRLLSDPVLSASILHGLKVNMQWLVPLYGHAAMLHDFVVQTAGAFEETLEGLLLLHEHGQQIQLRIVLIKPVLEQLEALSEFIGRNLPFVREVSLMACEPTGFALANRELCELDLKKWTDVLCNASSILTRHHIPHLLMNAPLCSLPSQLWDRAHRSISDWKQVYAPECNRCNEKENCSGLFAWHANGWAPSPITPFEDIRQ